MPPTYRYQARCLLPCLLAGFLFLGACSTRVAVAPQTPTGDYRIIGYVRGNDRMDLRHIDAAKLTHVNYAFANIAGGKVVPGRPSDAAYLAQVQSLKARNPDLKVLVSVGGWAWSDHFSDAALTPAARDTFAQSAVDLLVTYALDGIDIDWEYPGQPGEGNTHRPEDKENFTLLLQALRDHLDAQARRDGRTGADRYLLTIAAGAGPSWIAHTDMAAAQAPLDFVNLMTYDFSGSWSQETGHHANLYGAGTSAATAVALFLEAGVPREKLVLGVPFYGRWWSGVHAEANGLGQAYKGAVGALPYSELAAHYVDRGGYRRYWDEAAHAPYLWHADSTTFVTYEDPVSLAHKVAFVREHGLGGVMYWEHSHDPDEVLLDVLVEGLRR